MPKLQELLADKDIALYNTHLDFVKKCASAFEPTALAALIKEQATGLIIPEKFTIACTFGNALLAEAILQESHQSFMQLVPKIQIVQGRERISEEQLGVLERPFLDKMVTLHKQEMDIKQTTFIPDLQMVYKWSLGQLSFDNQKENEMLLDHLIFLSSGHIEQPDLILAFYEKILRDKPRDAVLCINLLADRLAANPLYAHDPLLQKDEQAVQAFVREIELKHIESQIIQSHQMSGGEIRHHVKQLAETKSNLEEAVNEEKAAKDPFEERLNAAISCSKALVEVQKQHKELSTIYDTEFEAFRSNQGSIQKIFNQSLSASLQEQQEKISTLNIQIKELSAQQAEHELSVAETEKRYISAQKSLQSHSQKLAELEQKQPSIDAIPLFALVKQRDALKKEIGNSAISDKLIDNLKHSQKKIALESIHSPSTYHDKLDLLGKNMFSGNQQYALAASQKKDKEGKILLFNSEVKNIASHCIKMHDFVKKMHDIMKDQIKEDEDKIKSMTKDRASKNQIKPFQDKIQSTQMIIDKYQEALHILDVLSNSIHMSKDDMVKAVKELQEVIKDKDLTECLQDALEEIGDSQKNHIKVTHHYLSHMKSMLEPIARSMDDATETQSIRNKLLEQMRSDAMNNLEKQAAMLDTTSKWKLEAAIKCTDMSQKPQQGAAVSSLEQQRATQPKATSLSK